MLDKQELLQFAAQAGADLTGIGSMERFEGTVPGKDPRYIAPSAKTIIGLGFRVLRGTLRGNEEGTQFFQYPEMSVVHLDEIYIPSVLRKVCCLLEDAGFEGVPLRAEPDRAHTSDPDTNPEHFPVHRISAVPAAPGRPAPDVMIDFNQAAVLCGMGEMGYGGVVLTPQFGPLQRFAFILTDAEVEPDEIMEPSLCDQCGDCMSAWPGNAYGNSTIEQFTAGNGTVPVLSPDSWQCAAYYMGANGTTNPFLDPERIRALPDGEAILRGEKQMTAELVLQLKAILEDSYPGMRFGYNAGICGRACWRACLIHLEEQQKLQTGFSLPFRIRKPWSLPL